MYIYGIGLCKDDNFKYIFNTEITHIYENLDEAKKYAEELCKKSLFPINIFKYKLNTTYKNIDENNNKQLLYKYYLDYKKQTIIETYKESNIYSNIESNKESNKESEYLCGF